MTSEVTLRCPACGEPVAAGKRFCADCGAPLAGSCPQCGAPAEPGKRFCADCGAPLAENPGPPPAAATPRPVAERRVCSVLFADLVGFTPLSESRDAEDVRELLSRYFALARTVVARYGGTIEKFIGDAVMAVWGVPVAREDDAERAVRAGLDMVDAVSQLGEEIRAPLALRVGIVTDEVAVTLGAAGEGMVAGDPVNTAARVQAAAAAGQVWVDATTRSLTMAGVAYADAGAHLLKGKTEPAALYAARGVVGTVGGAQRVDGLEAPFIGRERDLRLVKELFHATLEERRPRLVSVTGLPGVGKSRLGWEFFKYVDGISDVVRWHRGRCLAYGEGVAFWALSEMVRGRLDILEGEGPAAVAAKLDVGLARWVPDPEERAWLRPALATLVGAPGGAEGERAPGELFAAWQLFFERTVEPVSGGAVLLVEDVQWADDGLLDFLDQLVAGSAAPLFVLTLGRPEIHERRPGWGMGRRANALYLEPLPAPAMIQLVDGLVEGLSAPAREALVARAEGIPLYAVETVRALIDRDVVVPKGGRYVVSPQASGLDVTDLAAPTSLHTLLASRLDGLPPAERLTVQNAAVLGLSFTRGGLAQLNSATGVGDDVDALLATLVTKDIVAVETDPRSPERGQYRFVQAMVRAVAYETLSRRDRKARHLLAAAYLEQQPDADGFAAVPAHHYLDARGALPDEPDAADLAARAIELLQRAAQRAASLGSPVQAKRHYRTALEVATDPAVAAGLCLAAAQAALQANDIGETRELAERARVAFEELGEPVAAAHALAVSAEARSNAGFGAELPDELIPVYEAVRELPDAGSVPALLALQIGRGYFAGRGDAEAAAAWADRAVTLAEGLEDWRLLAEIIASYGAVLIISGRPTMGLGMLRIALEVARDHELPRAQLLPLNNLASFLGSRDPAAAITYADEGLALARRLGDADRALYLTGTAAMLRWLVGDWDGALSLVGDDDATAVPMARIYVSLIQLARGRPVAAATEVAEDGGKQFGSAAVACRAIAELSQGRQEEGLASALHALESYYDFGGVDDDFPAFWTLAMDAALTVGRPEVAHRWLDLVAGTPRGRLSPLLRALLPYFRARLAAGRGAAEPAVIEADFGAAAEALAAFGAPFWLARCQLDTAEWLAAAGRAAEAEPLLEAAEQALARLGADPYLERCARLRAQALRPRGVGDTGIEPVASSV